MTFTHLSFTSMPLGASGAAGLLTRSGGTTATVALASMFATLVILRYFGAPEFRGVGSKGTTMLAGVAIRELAGQVWRETRLATLIFQGHEFKSTASSGALNACLVPGGY